MNDEEGAAGGCEDGRLRGVLTLLPPATWKQRLLDFAIGRTRRIPLCGDPDDNPPSAPAPKSSADRGDNEGVAPACSCCQCGTHQDLQRKLPELLWAIERCVFLGYMILAFSTTALVFVLFALMWIVRWRGPA